MRGPEQRAAEASSPHSQGPGCLPSASVCQCLWRHLARRLRHTFRARHCAMVAAQGSTDQFKRSSAAGQPPARTTSALSCRSPREPVRLRLGVTVGPCMLHALLRALSSCVSAPSPAAASFPRPCLQHDPPQDRSRCRCPGAPQGVRGYPPPLRQGEAPGGARRPEGPAPAARPPELQAGRPVRLGESACWKTRAAGAGRVGSDRRRRGDQRLRMVRKEGMHTCGLGERRGV